MLYFRQEDDNMPRKAKEARLQMRMDAELFEWLDDYAKQRGTNRTQIITDFVMLLRKIDEGRHDKIKSRRLHLS